MHILQRECRWLQVTDLFAWDFLLPSGMGRTQQRLCKDKEEAAMLQRYIVTYVFYLCRRDGLLLFKSSGLRFLTSVRQAPPGSFKVRVGGLWRGLGWFTAPRQLSFDCSRLLLASSFQEEQSESVFCVECVRTEGVFKPAKCMRGERCLPESESHSVSAPFRLQVSSLNGPDYLPPYRTCHCHFWTGHICSPHIWDYRIRLSKLILKMIFLKFTFSILQEACWAAVCLYRLVIVFAHSQWMAHNYLITRKAASRISL